jgi:hypothetical protein
MQTGISDPSTHEDLRMIREGIWPGPDVSDKECEDALEALDRLIARLAKQDDQITRFRFQLSEATSRLAELETALYFSVPLSPP